MAQFGNIKILNPNVKQMSKPKCLKLVIWILSFIYNLKNTAGDINQISFIDTNLFEIVRRPNAPIDSTLGSAEIIILASELETNKNYFGP